MLSKYSMLFVIVVIMFISNYMMIMEYQNEYVPDNFDIEKIIHQKFRCIRYFNDKRVNTYQQRKCRDYTHEYVEFILERSRYIHLMYAYNFVIMCLFALFYLLVI